MSVLCAWLRLRHSVFFGADRATLNSLPTAPPQEAKKRELQAQLRRAEQEAAAAAAALDRKRAEQAECEKGASRAGLKPHERAAESAVSLRFLLAFHAGVRL